MIHAAPASRADIAKIMFDKEIFDRTNDDSVSDPENYDIKKANFKGWHFIGGYVSGQIASLFIVKDGQLHFWVQKKFRKFARLLLDASFKLWPHDVWCEIPSLYKSVINFAKNYGFEETEIIRGCYMKKNKLYNKHVLRYKWVA